MGDGGGWSVDYPRADTNLSIRLSELTKTSISTDTAGEPNHLVVRLTDPELFQCPVHHDDGGRLASTSARKRRSGCASICSRAASCGPTTSGAPTRGRTGQSEFSKVLPPSEYPMRDLPRDHPMFRTQFTVEPRAADSVDQPLDGYGGTSERGADSAVPHALGRHRRQRPAAGPRHLQHGSRRLVGARG